MSKNVPYIFKIFIYWAVVHGRPYVRHGNTKIYTRKIQEWTRKVILISRKPSLAVFECKHILYNSCFEHLRHNYHFVKSFIHSTTSISCHALNTWFTWKEIIMVLNLIMIMVIYYLTFNKYSLLMRPCLYSDNSLKGKLLFPFYRCLIWFLFLHNHPSEAWGRKNLQLLHTLFLSFSFFLLI